MKFAYDGFTNDVYEINDKPMDAKQYRLANTIQVQDHEGNMFSLDVFVPVGFTGSHVDLWVEFEADNKEEAEAKADAFKKAFGIA